jgi:hypothetical protein
MTREGAVAPASGQGLQWGPEERRTRAAQVCKFITHPATPAGDEADGPDTVPASAPLGAKRPKPKTQPVDTERAEPGVPKSGGPAAAPRQASKPPSAGQALAQPGRSHASKWAGPGPGSARPTAPSVLGTEEARRVTRQGRAGPGPGPAGRSGEPAGGDRGDKGFCGEERQRKG